MMIGNKTLHLLIRFVTVKEMKKRLFTLMLIVTVDCSLSHRIVLVAIQDEGSLFSLAAYKELEVLGTGNSVFPWYRGSYALVGYGLSDYRRPSWVKQEQYPDSLGPSVIKVKIPLRKQPYL